MQNSSYSSELLLVCRPYPALWIGVVLSALMALVGPLMAWNGDPRIATAGDWWAMWIMVALFGLPALIGAFVLGHHRIIVDANGLTFRGFHRRRFAAWAEIEDFELRAASNNSTAMVNARSGNPHIKIGGEWHRITAIYTGHATLLSLIERHATAAKARRWQLGDLREDGDWPKHFEYHDVSGGRILGQYLLLSFGLFAAHTCQAAASGWANFVATATLMWQVSPPLDRFGMIATLVFANGAMPLIILTRYPAILARRPYRDQKIIATREEISLFRDHRKISLKWDEIDSYHLETLPGHFQPDKSVIQAGSARIEFVSGISKTKSLLALVQKRATNVTTTQWLHKNGATEDVLGGATSLYRDGNVGVGPKIHHYRTRTARAILPFGALMSAMLLLSPMLGNRNGTPKTTADIMAPLLFGACMAIPTLYGVLGVCFSRLQCEDDGLRQHSFLGERFLRWSEIKSLVFNDHYYRVSARHQKIRFGLVADYQGLVAEIEKRAGIESKRDTNAV